MSKGLNKALLNKDVQDFINKNLKTDLTKLILKGSPFPDLTVQELAVQIESKNKAEKKLPTWFKTPRILFPPKINLEQTSSEITAKYKASLINKGKLIDLSGGFGVDDYYFAGQAEEVIHCEINSELSEIVKHNAEVFQLNNFKTVIGDSTQFLKHTDKVETLYVDPSRRANAGRVFLLKDCEPNVLENLPLYFKKAKKIIIKAAPMLDISSAIKELQQVSEIHIISLNNECKELLFVLEDKKISEPKIYCALLNQKENQVLEFFYSEEKALEIKPQVLQNYLYEPDAAILKAGFFKSLTTKFNVGKLHQHSHLYTSLEPINFPGKSFKVLKSFPFTKFNKSLVPAKVNISTRNFDLKPEEIKKQFKLKDGGNEMLFFTTNSKNEKIVILAERVS